MSTPNNNLNILPFYSSIDEQNHRKEYAFGNIYPLPCSRRRLLPFQLNRAHSAATPVTGVTLVSYEDGSQQDITAQALGAGGIMVREFADDGYDLIINNSTLNFSSLEMPLGRHYLVITDDTNTWYSDIFTVVQDLSRMIKLEYFDKDKILYTGGHLDYTTPFRNYLYIDSEIGKPEYPFIEEAQDRGGRPFIEKQISEKKYKFEFPAPEYLTDALRVVRMHDKIRIYHRGKIYDVDNIMFTPEWEEQGDIAIVTCEFECDTIVKKVGKGITPTGLGDFNDDYNEDFYNF